ncbi:probable G-protein coupled receptor 141 [Cololabis saira]|uniref:probable G-protein coupled receptor 141 n=1 Tax=Cololabis saira TaxID=129043 RepID=UPI002AD2D7DA|nr:probable G-protein coupled receptor 141 [Cololabis saira]
MNSTTSQTTLSTAAMTTKNSSVTASKEYHTSLLTIYSVVLLCGTVSLSLMMHILKSSTVSTTSIAVFNLMFAHFIFLLTVPFRIYYYANQTWNLSYEWCKMVSAMIHIHMYMSYVLYVIVLVSRLLTFYNRARQVASIQRMHALIGSVLVWIIVLVTTTLVIHNHYGNNKNGTDHQNITTQNICFKFGKNIKEFTAFNYILSTLVIVVALVLTALQANVLRVLYRKYHQTCTSQQEFVAQVKSLFFALIMVVCFVPYHIFRIYYLTNVNLENLNELFLSLTTFNCLDMLTFLGRRTCTRCFPGRAV